MLNWFDRRQQNCITASGSSCVTSWSGQILPRCPGNAWCRQGDPRLMPSMHSTRPVKGIQSDQSDVSKWSNTSTHHWAWDALGHWTGCFGSSLLSTCSSQPWKVQANEGGGRWGLGYQMVMMLSHSEAEGAWWILLTQQHVPDSSLGHFINPSQPAQCQGSDKTATSRGSEARRGFTIHLGSSADLMTWMREGRMEDRFYVNVLLASHFSSGYDIGLISAVLCSLVL